MIQSSLAFAKRLKSGDIPQAALIAHLTTHNLIFARDGIVTTGGSLDALILADGSHLADGTAQAGAGSIGETVEYGALQFGQIQDGGDLNASSVTVLPSRRSTLTVTIANASGRLSDLLVGEVLAGADAELVLTYPGLAVSDRLTRFQGEIARETIADDNYVLDLRAA